MIKAERYFKMCHSSKLIYERGVSMVFGHAIAIPLFRIKEDPLVKEN